MPMTLAQWAAFKNELLTAFSVGWKPARHINRLVLPPIPVRRSSGEYLVEANGRVLYDTSRALRSKPRMTEYSAETGTWTTQEHALGGVLDYQEIKEADQTGVAALQGLKQRRIAQLMVNLEDVREKTVSDHVFGDSYYHTDHYKALTSGNEWNNADSDPIGDIMTGIAAVRSAIGFAPNSLVMSYDTYMALANHPQLIGMFKNQMGLLSAEQIKSLFPSIKNIVIGEGTYNGGSLEVPTVAEFWGNKCAIIDIPTSEELAMGAQVHSIVLDKTIDYLTAEQAILTGFEFMQSVRWGIQTVNNKAGYLIGNTIASA